MKTVSFRVHNDMMCSLANRRDVIFIMFDLLATFDTIDNHAILVRRLHTKLGINVASLELFSFYLNCRTQRVEFGMAMSDPLLVYCGVPQGIVLGPVLFYMRTMPQEDMICHHCST